MFILEDMAIDAIVVVAIMISAYILTAIIADWRSNRRPRSDQRQRRARRYSRQTRGWVPRG